MASTSKIEDIIDEIEAYIDDCKPSAFSTNKIVVNRDELESLIQELRTKTPDEIKKYQRMIANREQILAKLRHFDNDSQGGEGWCCDNCDSVIWLSWFHPEGGNADG